MTRVLIADDHPAARAGLRQVLEGHGFEVVAEAADAAGAIEAASQTRPDVCVLDIHMPGSGIYAAGEITRLLSESTVVMLTISRNDDDLFDALRAGASGYLLKDMDPARIPYALEGVLRGEAALPRALTARVLDEFRQRSRRRRLPLSGEPGVDLTSREWQVLELMRDGLTTAEIADRLFVTRVTVRRHVASVLRKLRVGSRQEAIDRVEKRSDT
jgi:DNA-binding NarL/FixJ family response regulator